MIEGKTRGADVGANANGGADILRLSYSATSGRVCCCHQLRIAACAHTLDQEQFTIILLKTLMEGRGILDVLLPPLLLSFTNLVQFLF